MLLFKNQPNQIYSWEIGRSPLLNYMSMQHLLLKSNTMLHHELRLISLSLISVYEFIFVSRGVPCAMLFQIY